MNGHLLLMSAAGEAELLIRRSAVTTAAISTKADTDFMILTVRNITAGKINTKRTLARAEYKSQPVE